MQATMHCQAHPGPRTRSASAGSSIVRLQQCRLGSSGYLRRRIANAAMAEPCVLLSAATEHNPNIQIIEFPQGMGPPYEGLAGSRILILDHSGNVHSMWRPEVAPTGGYFDVLATLPALVPQGTMGILGLGAGTLPRMVQWYHPGQRMVGWELDAAVVMAARMHMGMQELEAAGALEARVGDALAPEASIPGGFTGLVVDIFSEGALPDVMTQPDTWRAIKAKLADVPGARVMANLGAATAGPQLGRPARPEGYTTIRALDAMLEVFGEGQVQTLDMQQMGGGAGNANCIAITGDLASLQSSWQANNLPSELAHLVAEQEPWRTYASAKLPF